MHVHVLTLLRKFELIQFKIRFFTNFLSCSKIGPKPLYYTCRYSLSFLVTKVLVISSNFSRFTDKPKKGIKFLQEKGLLGQLPEDVAQFLFSDDRLDKVRLVL